MSQELPEQIRKQREAAQAIIAKHYGPQPGAEGDAANAAPAAAPAAADAPAPVGEAAAPVPADTPAQTSAVEAAPPAGSSTPEDENSATYAQRWRSLQGQFNRAQALLQETVAAKQSLELLVTQMQMAPTAAAAGQPKHVTDKDRTEFGVDMVDFARRVTREEMAPLAQAVQMLAARIDQLQGVVPQVQRVAQAQAQTAEERFFEALTRRVPSWKAVNEAPAFHQWLLSADPISGLQRQVILEDAHQRLDLERVVSIFTAGMAATGASPAPASTAATPTPSAAATRLERQVAPGRASAATAPPKQVEKKQWTRDGIRQFFADKQRGVYKGREEEAKSIERDIFNAQSEGRMSLSTA
jgi:hypothetical protein